MPSYQRSDLGAPFRHQVNEEVCHIRTSLADMVPEGFKSNREDKWGSEPNTMSKRNCLGVPEAKVLIVRQ